MEGTSKIKIVFMVGGPMTSRWNDYYCLDFLSNYFDIEFWNFYKIIEGGYLVSSPLKRDYEVELTDIDSLNCNLKRLPPKSLFVIELGFIESYYKILRIISRYNSNCIIIDFWSYYVWDVVNEHTENKFSQIPEFGLYKKIKNKIKTNILLRFLRELIIYNGYKDISSLFNKYKLKLKEQHSIFIEKKCNKLFNKYLITYKPFHKYSINHPDYEKYLRIKDHSEKNEKYIVFIADFYPYHPEIILDNDVNKDDVAKLYHESLNVFFDRLEDAYDCKVIIAEHPSAKWDTNPFNNRRIVYYKTAELVRDCFAVCMHASCAFSYVALFNKPVAIITNNALQYCRGMRIYIPKIAEAIGRELLNIDRITSITDVFKFIPIDIRQKFIQTFADADNDLSNEELFKKHYVSIFNEIYGINK